MEYIGAIENSMSNEERKRFNLYLPEEDGEAILKAVRHAAVDAGIKVNTLVFKVLRKEFGLPEPTKKKAALSAPSKKK